MAVLINQIDKEHSDFNKVLDELKDKMGPALETGISGVSVAAQPQSGKLSEAASALSSLGYSQSEIAMALKDLPVEQLPLEEIVRQALRAMLKK